ncbi:MAG TPA: LytTR family DNA-binding domain-containing protein [Flavisolibacter sp.]|nr:LytTR family DNA-binding domain-containing protein [Flavisolibacter sp.]
MILTQPFPAYAPSISRLRFPFIAGVVVFLILLFFRPFRFNEITTSFFPLHAFLYGFGTFSMGTLNAMLLPKLFPSWFEEKVWTVGRELLFMLWQIVSISFVNMLLTQLLYGGRFSFLTIGHFLGYTMTIGIFPITILVLLKYVILLKRNQIAAAEMEGQIKVEQPAASSPTLVKLTGDYQNEVLEAPIDTIRYISSADNYIKVYYVENDKLAAKVLRSTLKKTEQSLQDFPQFFRCHRAFVVNLEKVKHVTGNAQGLKLHLQNIEEPIPVSRNLTQQLTYHLQQQKSLAS